MGVFYKIRWSLEQRGLTRTIVSATKSLGRKFFGRQETQVAHPFDVQNMVTTDGLIPGHDLAVGHANDRFIAGYAAIPPSRFYGAMDRWQASRPAHALGEYTFIDFGCGKGRAVLLASKLGFREVIGVELNTKLAEIAQTNVTQWNSQGKATSPIRIVCGDALELEWPTGPCLVYLYNPFAEPVMQRLADRMKMHFGANPTNLEIVYQKPEHADVFQKGFQMVWCEVIPMSEDDRRAEFVASPTDESRAYRLSIER